MDGGDSRHGARRGKVRRCALLTVAILLAAMGLLVRAPIAKAACDSPTFVSGTDVTANLQQALDCGGKVSLPSGTFYVHRPVHLHPGNVLSGTGMDETIVTANTDPALGPVWPAWGPDGGLANPTDSLVDPDSGICLPHSRDHCREVARMTLDGNWGRATNVLGGTGTLIDSVKVTGGACNGIVDYGTGMELYNSLVIWNGDMPGRSGRCVGAPSDRAGGPGIYIQPWSFARGEWKDGWFVGLDITPTVIANNTIALNGSFGLDAQGVGGSYAAGTYVEFHHNHVIGGGISLFGSSRWHLHDNQIDSGLGSTTHSGHPVCEGIGKESHAAAVNACADDSRPCAVPLDPCPANEQPPAPWQSNGEWIEANQLAGWYGLAFLGSPDNYPSGSLVRANQRDESIVGHVESHPGANTWLGTASSH